MDTDLDEEEMKDTRLSNKRKCHWRMGFKDNDGGVDDHKVILHAKMWDVYMNKKKELIKGGYSMEVSGSDEKKVLWELVNDHVVEEGKEHDDIGRRGVWF